MEKEKFNKEPEKLINSKPRLENIYKTLGLLEGYTEWKKDLPEKIGPWENSLELFNNVQKAVLEQVKDKALLFRDKIHSISEISDQDIIDTIINNWPEAIPEVQGQRREVLLNVAAHAIKHLETSAYQEVIANASEEELGKLGLNSELRNVTTKLLDASMRADNLFIRFLAFSKLSPDSPSKSKSKFYLSEEEGPRTINELFSRDTQYLSRKLKEISEMPIEWGKIPGGDTFKEYLVALSKSYQETDVRKINAKYKTVSDLYSELASSDFPILIIPSAYTEGGGEKDPYYDPELRVGLRSTECIEIEKSLLPKQETMANMLKEDGREDLSEILAKKKVKVINSIGDYGVNLKSKATAQMGESVAIIFLGEQIKAHKEMRAGKNFRVEGLKSEKSQEMSLYCTLLHEFGHLHIKGSAPKRLGTDSRDIIQESEAEQLYRCFVPRMIETGGLEGTKEEWAAALVENSLVELKDKSEEGDALYYYSAAYTLNKLFAEKIIEFDFGTGNVSIKDIDKFYHAQEELSKEVLSLFDDKLMNKKKADKWVEKNCKPNEIVQKVSKFIKEEEVKKVEEDLTASNELPNNPKIGPVKVFPWERAWIKRADPENPDDVKMLKLIDDQPEVAKYMVGPDLTPKDFTEKNFYGVCAEKPRGKILGFVWLYEPEKDKLRDLKKRNLIDPSTNKEFLEISFARLVDENLPIEEQVWGLMPSAIRQICFSLLKKQEKITIMAFVSPKNLLSEGVLKNIGFVKGKVYYDKKFKEEDNLWILDKNELEKILKKKERAVV